MIFPRNAVWAIGLTVVLLAACATPPRPEAMTVTAAPSAAKSARTLRVAAVTGGQTTDPSGLTSLGNDEFNRALVASLNGSQIFSEIVSEDSAEDADWELRTFIASQERRGAFRNTQELMIRYEIFSGSNVQPLWAETVYSSQEMGVDDIFSGNERAHVLLESTAKQNIAEFLKRLEQWLVRTAPA